MTTTQSIVDMLSSLPNCIGNDLSSILAGRTDRQEKADGSYVTKGDLRVQELILQQIATFAPSAHVVSEEMPLHGRSTDSGTVIVVDPIDGTENFTSGLPEWGVSISCYHNNVHMASLLGCPEMNVWLQSGVKVAKFTSRIRGLSSSLSKEDLIAATQGYEYRILGCCVYNMLNVIRGSLRSFENPKGAHNWDILAGLNLARENGLTVTVEGGVYAGEYLPPDRKYRFKVENR